MRWESDGGGEFTVEAVERADRGTEVTLHLREGEDELARRRPAARASSASTPTTSLLPIVMKKEEWDKDKRDYRTTGEDETVNQASALWARPRNEITRRAVPRVLQARRARLRAAARLDAHARVEGRKEYTQLLYVPARAPFDLWDREHRHGIKLYVRRVFIMDDAEQLMPAYLRFVRGVIDSNDLPLNVSREILQESQGRRGDPRRLGASACSSLLEDLAENAARTKYATFWKEFGRVLKEGVGEDRGQPRAHRQAAALRLDARRHRRADRVARRLRRAHEAGAGQDLLRDRRHLRRGAQQPAPRDLPQEGHRGAAAVPIASTSGWSAHLTEFDGKPLQSVAKGELDLGKLEDEQEKKEQEKEAGEFKDLVERIKQGAGRARQGRARDAAADRFTGVPGRRRARHERQPGAHAQGRRARRCRRRSRSSRSIRAIRWCSG